MNTVIADFTFGHTEVYTEPLTQWDYGQVLQIVGLDLPPVVEIRFSVKSYATINSIPVIGITTNKITKVDIPDGLLQQSRDLIAKIFIGNRETGKTDKIINIPIIDSEKPLVPHAPEDQLKFMEVIEASNNAMQAATQTSADAKQTSADRKRVEELVKTVETVEQQVIEVRNIRQQVANDKTDVSTMKSEVNQTKLDILAIKDAVLLSEQKTLEHKNTTEQLKTSMEALNNSFSNSVVQGKTDITDAKNIAIENINTTKTGVLSEINNAKNSALNEMTVKIATIEEIKSYLQI